MFCSNCGNEISEGCKFCPECGAQVIANVAANTEVIKDYEPETQTETVEQTYYDNNIEETPETAAAYVNSDITEEASEDAVSDTCAGMDSDAQADSDMSTDDEASQNSSYTYSFEGAEDSEKYSNTYGQTNQTGIGFSIASLVCGIMSITCCIAFPCTFPLAIIALVLGIISVRSQYEGKGLAIGGIVTGSIGALLLVMMLCLYCLGSVDNADIMNEVQESIEEVF